FDLGGRRRRVDAQHQERICGVLAREVLEVVGLDRADHLMLESKLFARSSGELGNNSQISATIARNARRPTPASSITGCCACSARARSSRLDAAATSIASVTCAAAQSSASAIERGSRQ